MALEVQLPLQHHDDGEAARIRRPAALKLAMQLIENNWSTADGTPPALILRSPIDRSLIDRWRSRRHQHLVEMQLARLSIESHTSAVIDTPGHI